MGRAASAKRQRRGETAAPRAAMRGYGVMAAVAAGIAATAVGGWILLRPAGTPNAASVGDDLHSLVMGPESATLFVGGHDAVGVSLDGGGTWQPVASLAGADAMGWAWSGHEIWVGGHPGLLKSSDGGSTFIQVDMVDTHALGGGGDLLYRASPSSGFSMSTDGGATWSLRSDLVGQGFMGAILVDQADPQHLLATDMQLGVVGSRNGGRSWKTVPGLRGAMWLSGALGRGSLLVASGPAGAATMSTDGGATWVGLQVPSRTLVVSVDPNDPQTLYAASHQGTDATVEVSHDRGASWSVP